MASSAVDQLPIINLVPQLMYKLTLWPVAVFYVLP